MPDNLRSDEWMRLIRMIRVGEPLPEKARSWLAELLEIISRGEDPREFLGTKSGPGRPPDARAIVGMFYWGLRAKYGRGGELAARQEAAQAWCLSAERVGAIGRNTRAAFKDSMSRVDSLDNVLDAIRAESPGLQYKLVEK